MVVEQVVELSAVDLVHRHCDGEVSLVVFPVVDASFEEVLYSDVLDPVHGVSLARASLSVGKDGHDSLVEDQVEDGSHLEKVKLLIRLLFAK